MTSSRIRQSGEFVVVALLAGLAGLITVETLSADGDLVRRGPIDERAVPLIVSGLLALCAVLIALDLLRGGRGVPEDGEPGDKSDWRTWSVILGAILLTAAIIDTVGWVIAGGAMFYLCAIAFGSRHYVRDLVVAGVLAVGSFYLFYSGLGIALPAGVLQGIL